MPEIKEKWEEIKEYIKVEFDINPVSYDTWIAPLQLFDVVDNLVKITIPSENSHALNYITNKYKSFFTVAISEMFNSTYEVVFILDKANEDFEEEKNLINSVASNINYINANLNSKYKFTSFITGNNNKLAKSAALAVAESPGEVYNPLYIYGGVGLGKTHLMHAIGHEILKRNPEMRVLYISSEKFTNELINSIRNNTTEEFRQKYRKIDVLLVDDMQFLYKKVGTQEEFFHTFNALYDAKKQIILSSDRPPREIETLEERLRSRFEWGLQTDIQAPDLETRVAILKKKAVLENISVPNDALFYIASRIDSNIRELEGALTRVVAYSSINNQPITTELVSEAMNAIYPKERTQAITIELIQEIVAAYYSLDVKELSAKKRTRELAFPRQIAMYLCRKLTDYSLPQIGNEFGGRDHTTVLHACEKIDKDRQEDTKLDAAIKELMQRIQKM